MEKIKSGIYGLNPLLDGGFNEKSTNVVLGFPGTGKTTFATQFIKRGLEMGQTGIFISLDENQDQIVREATERGWAEIADYVEDGLLLFVDASGREFTTFIHDELPKFVTKWSGANARISIDPLTPVIWASEHRYDQRELLSILMKELKKVGTVVCTLEQYGSEEQISTNETIIPMYIADSVIHLRFKRKENQEGFDRELEIVKCRNSRHSKLSHQYKILHGFGIIVQRSDIIKRATHRVPNELKKEIMKHKKISKSTLKMILDYLDSLNDEDFRELDTGNVIKSLLEEYT